MTVKRYCKDGYHAEHKEGTFVAFEDYAKLQARVELLENSVLRMFQTREAYRNYPGNPGDDAHHKFWVEHQKARKAVEELLK